MKSDAVADRVRQQVECGIDIVTDGEMSKVSFLGYVKDRLGGFEVEMGAVADGAVVAGGGRRLPRVLRRLLQEVLVDGRAAAADHLHAARSATSGQDLLQTDIDNLKAAHRGLRRGRRVHAVDGAERVRPQRVLRHRTRSTSTPSPRRCARSTSAIVAAGFILQVDDPFLIDMLSDPTMEQEERERLAWVHVEALNHALREHPAREVRHHTCYGLNHGPRMNDIPLIEAVPFMLAINAGAHSFEVANPRHYHEWRIWEDVKLPDDKILIPGLHRPRHELRRAPRADRRLHREVRRARRHART